MIAGKIAYAKIASILLPAEFPAILEMNTNHARRSNCRRAFFFGAKKDD